MRGCRYLICINQSIDRENIKKEMKRFIYNALLLLAVFIATGCSSGENTATRKSKEEIAAERKKDSLALKVGVAQTINCLPAFVAQDEGIFDSLGVDVRLRHYTSMLDCDVSLRRHTIEGVYRREKNGLSELPLQESPTEERYADRHAMAACRQPLVATARTETVYRQDGCHDKVFGNRLSVRQNGRQRKAEQGTRVPHTGERCRSPSEYAAE